VIAARDFKARIACGFSLLCSAEIKTAAAVPWDSLDRTTMLLLVFICSRALAVVAGGAHKKTVMINNRGEAAVQVGTAGLALRKLDPRYKLKKKSRPGLEKGAGQWNFWTYAVEAAESSVAFQPPMPYSRIL